MISETLEPVMYGGLAICMWAIVVFLWCVLIYILVDYTQYSIKETDYVLSGIAVIVMITITFILIMATLSLLGV